MGFSARLAIKRSSVGLSFDAEVDGTTSSRNLGSVNFDPSLFGLSKTYKFTATLSVSDVARVAEVRLYNLTDGEQVTTGALTTSSTTMVPLSATLTVGNAAGNLKPTAKVYQARIYTDGTLVTDRTFLGSAQITVE
jgi:hypothetical protein